MDRKSFDVKMRELEQPNNISLGNEHPLIIRIDGKAFHTYHKNFSKHFSDKMQELMLSAMKFVMVNNPEIKFGYTNSDEITLVLYPQSKLYKNRLEKIVSLTASYATAGFNQNNKNLTPAVFDSRVFDGVDFKTVKDNLMWRQESGKRNAINTYAREYLSRSEMKNANPVQLENKLLKHGVPRLTRDGFYYGYYMTAFDNYVSHVAHGNIAEIMNVYYPLKFE